MNTKLLGYAEMVGLVLIAMAAALWIIDHDVTPFVFTLGTALLAVARLTPNRDAIIRNATPDKRIVLKRLLRQRDFGIVLLAISSAIMLFVRHTTYVTGDLYLFPIHWLMPFMAFVIIETYTAFRIPKLL